MKKIVFFSAGLASISVVLLLAYFAPEKIPAVPMDQHPMSEINENYLLPSLALRALPDMHNGYNLILDMNDFEIGMPPSMVHENHPMSANSVFQGHAHLYVNGVKIQRIYGQFVHIPNAFLVAGDNHIVVSLNTHSHENLTKNGKVISSSMVIQTQASSSVHKMN